jgi:hypothetical protein
MLSGLDLSSTIPRGREMGEAGAIKLVESLCEQLLHSEEDAAGVLERLALLLRDKAQTLRGGCVQTYMYLSTHIHIYIYIFACV